MKRHIQLCRLLLRAEIMKRYGKATVVCASCGTLHPSFDVQMLFLSKSSVLDHADSMSEQTSKGSSHSFASFEKKRLCTISEQDS